MNFWAACNWRRGVPLHVCVSAIVVGTVTLMTVLNLYLVHSESTNLGKQYAAETFEIISNSAEREVFSRIDPILSLARSAAALPPLHNGKLTWAKAKKAYLRSSIQALTAHQNILAVNYGYADGNFFSVTALRDDKVRNNYKAPSQSAFALWGVTLDDAGNTKERWSFLDENFKELGGKMSAPIYDPRTRAWYSDAANKNAFVMTAPYIFNTSKELGLAVALPLVHEKGVFSINISLRNFDSLLDSIPLTDSGYLFILDEKRRIMGERSPKAENGNSKVKAENTRQLLPFELYPQPEVSGISSYLDQCATSDDILLLTIKSVDYFLACKRISLGIQSIELVMLSPMEDFTGVVEKFFSRTMLFAIITMLVFIPVAIWLAFRVGATLKALLRETLLVKQLDWSSTEQVPSRIMEIRRLAHAISTMRKSIHRRTDALKHVQNSLEETVRTRTGELRHALDMAEEATQAKSKFLSTVSHEIRTPMNAIVGFTYLFNRSNLSPKQQDYLEKIRISSETLLRIINDVLDFSKIEDGKLEIENIPFHLGTVLDTVVSITKFPATEKKLELVIEQAPDVPERLVGDPTRIHQILLNLISNAIKFTDTGRVELRVRKAKRQPASQAHDNSHVALLFSVCDTGIGMSQEQTERLFKPFAQADSSISRKYGGTGLGLAICKQLAELMGGTISVRSTIGQGTCFDVVIHLSHISPEGLTLLHEEVESKAVWQQNALILVVDDNAINREIAGALLENANLRVEFAENGLEAVEKVQNTAYDLIFMDMQMPVMDGLKSARCIRRLAQSRKPSATDPVHVPIIAMTANAMIEDRHRCLKAGMNDHIAKPIVPATLLGLLGLWLPPR